MQKNNPKPEDLRLAALQSYQVLDSATEQDYEEMTELAAAICGTPIALISFVDKNRQWFKSHRGLKVSETDRAFSFCAHAIDNPTELLQVSDAHLDDRFRDNPLVTGELNISFYAGMPLVDSDGHALGSLCVIDQKPRQLSPIQQSALRTLAKQVVEKLRLRRKLLMSEDAHNNVSWLNQKLVSKEREAMEIIRHAPLAMALHLGDDMVIRFANPLMLAAWGKTEDLFYLPFDIALPELAALDFPKTMRRVLHTGIAYEQKEAHMTYVHQGEAKEFYYNYAFIPLKRSDGSVWGILNTAQDISSEVKNRLKAEQAEDQFRIAVETAELGTWYIDAETREFHPSQRLKELFGYLPHEYMSYDAAIEQITEEYRSRVRQAVEMVVTKGEPYDLEYPIIGFHDKKLRWVRARGKMYQTTKGRAANFTGSAIDITERKLEEQRKTDFVGVASHELRSPLTSLNGYVQMLSLKAAKSGDETIKNISGKAQRQIDRMRSLISALLDAARVGEGKLALNKRYFDIADLMQQAEEESLTTITSHTIIYHPVEAVTVNADYDKIEQVVVNFINNAVKYSPHGSTINVSCVRKREALQVCVKDEGMGITLQNQPRIFDRFFRVESEQTQTIKGFGIGLYICRDIIEHHGGRIGVNSEVDKGSEFWFELPLLHQPVV